jgi:multiple sugar transport system permease protein
MAAISRLLDKWALLILVTPAIVTLALLLVYPIGYTLWGSLQDWTLTRGFSGHFGLQNYSRLLKDDKFWSALVITFYFTALSLTVQTVLGVGLGLLFNREFWGRGLLRALAILPMVATPVAISLIFVLVYHPTLGVANFFLSKLHIPPQLWIHSPRTVIPSLAIVDTWQWTPLLMLITLAGLSSLPSEPYEAALIDGASPRQTFFYITLPMLRPFLAAGIIFRLIDSLKTFDIIYVMTQGGPGVASQTLNIQLYNVAFNYMDMGYAAALTVVFFTVIVGVSLVVVRARRA